MQENNFEKRVQQQMEELKLRPSEAVWEKVEEEIRRKKKRRVVFFISLLAGLSLLSYSGYFLINKSKPNLVEQNSTLTDKKQSNINNQPQPTIKNEEGTIVQPAKENQVKENEPTLNEESPADNEKNIATDKKINSTGIDDIKSNNKDAEKEKNIIPQKQDRKIVKSATNKNLLVEKRGTDNKNKVASAKRILSSTKKVQPQQKDESEPSINQTDIAKSADIEKNTVVENNVTTGKTPTDEKELITKDNKKDEPKKDSIAKEEIAATTKEEIKPTPTKKKKIPSINFGIELSYGVSSSRENAFSIGDDQKSMDVMYSAPQANVGGSPTANPSPSAIYYLPSSIHSGAAFRAGLVAEMKLSKRSTVSSGLRYAYFSNNIKVGAYKDTAISFTNAFSPDFRTNAIYRGYQQREFVNRFHFIQVPLQYELQLNRGIKLPISWNIGATASYLVSTNALTYDTAASGIYYHDKSAFNKFQWNLNTGFSFRFGNKNKIQWSLGPELSLSMNKLTKDYTKRQYLVYGGITGRIFLVKKK